MQERRLAILKFSQDKPQNDFLTFLSSKNIFIITIFRGYPWNIFDTDIRGMFLEYSENITLWLLEFAKRWTFVIIKSYNLFFFKMFRKRSLNIATTREHSANIPGILRACWVWSINYLPWCWLNENENLDARLWFIALVVFY